MELNERKKLIEALPPAQPFDKYVIRAQEDSVDVTEKLFRDLYVLQRAAQVLNKLFSDRNAELFLKKIINGRVEKLLANLYSLEEEASVRKEHIPPFFADPLEASVIEKLHFSFIGSSGRYLTFSLAAVSQYKQFSVQIYAALRWFISKFRKITFAKIIKGRFLFGIENLWPINCKWGSLRSLDFILDDRRITKKELLVLMLRGRTFEAELRDGKYNFIYPNELRVPVSWYLLNVLGFIKFLANSLILTSSWIWNAYLGTIILGAFRDYLGWDLLMQNYYIRNIFDFAEYSHSHIIKTLTISKYGCRSVRLPYTQIDSPGVALSYIYYSYFFSSGNYLLNTYSATWSKDTKCISVGMMFNDELFCSEYNMAKSDLGDLLKTVKRENKILAVFTSSFIENITSKLNYELIEIAAEFIEVFKGWVIFIKPKPGHYKFLFERPIFNLVERYLIGERLFILTPPNGLFCSAQFLLRYSDLNLAYGGSIVPEALSAGRPIFVYPMKWIPETPFVKMLDDKILIRDKEKLALQMAKYANGEAPDLFEFNEYSQLFGAGQSDGETINRIRDYLWKES